MKEYDPESEMRVVEARVDGWYEAFVGNLQYERLTRTQKDVAPAVVRFFAEYSFRYIGAKPEEWNQGVLRECCLEVMPRKVSAEPDFFQAMATVLAAFFDFLGEKGLLGSARHLAKAVVELDTDIVAASQDARNWGPAKSFVMAAEKAGINTCDQEAMRLFMIEYNLRQFPGTQAAPAAPALPPPSLRPLATPVRHSQPKTGRNDPCPCGSGKKFKKCCGALSRSLP